MRRAGMPGSHHKFVCSKQEVKTSTPAINRNTAGSFVQMLTKAEQKKKVVLQVLRSTYVSLHSLIDFQIRGIKSRRRERKIHTHTPLHCIRKAAISYFLLPSLKED
jgi:hypothetical protein